MISDNWETPYSVEPKGILLFRFFQVMFEGAGILEFTDRGTANHVAAALNGAYNLGALSAINHQLLKEK